jgi:Uri superfamily endonuclease
MIVYRVKLMSSIINCAKFRSRNPHQITGACYYVGSTALPLIDRLRRHFVGGFGGNHIIKAWGGYIDGDEAAGHSFVVSSGRNRAEAEAMEKLYAAELQQCGHGVWTNVKERR